jgi:dipeptidyl aminopeptidase/acylaminoacyl peptidase
MVCMNALVRVLAVFVALAVMAPAAQAAFPGRNGAIGFAFRADSGGSGPIVERAGLAARLLSRDDARTLVECEQTDGVPTGGDCTATSFLSPSYSPDGSSLVFDAGERLGAIGAGGAGLYLLPPVTADDGDPAFAPDGKRIVFTGTNERGTTDLYRHRLGSMFARMIVSDASEPAWSSRNEIAYVRGGNVYVARPDGSHRRRVTSGRTPDWSPNGGRLVVVRPRPTLTFDDALGRMFVVGAHGRGLRRLGRVDDASGPVWSPDGRWVAYNRFDAGIFAKRLASSAPAREVAITQVSGESGSIGSFGPTWRPLRR